MITHGKEGLL